MTSVPSARLHLAAPPAIRRIGEADLNWALSEGWKDFSAKRGDIVFLALLYPLVGLAAAVMAVNERFLPLFFPLVAGLSVLGPAVASGFYELARRREQGLDAGWSHFLDPMRGRSRSALLIMTLGLVFLFFAWVATAAAIHAATLGQLGPMSLGLFLQRLFDSPEGWALIVVGNLVGLAFAVVTITLSLVSFPMVVDRPVDAWTAMATSIRAVRANPAATASWGLRVAILLALGCIPAFIGLAVVLPVLGYATWHLYTRLVER